MARPPLLEVRNSALPWRGDTTVRLFENRLEIDKTVFGGVRTSTVPYKQIAHAGVEGGFFSSNLVFETTGGGTVRIAGVRLKPAHAACDLVMDRLYPDDDAPTLTYL